MHIILNKGKSVNEGIMMSLKLDLKLSFTIN